jgi:uncharacterized repeat protein (TIGR03833 family)
MRPLPKTQAEKSVTDGGESPARASGSKPPARKELQIGSRVAIVQKQDQASGKLTYGRIKKILTNSPAHPHGIKVSLEDGAVGRVQAQLPP